MADKISNAFPGSEFLIAPRLCKDVTVSRTNTGAAAIPQPTNGNQDIPKPRNHRWYGYGTDAASAYCCWLTSGGRQAQGQFLTLELLFPFLYGGALAVSLWWVWMALEQPFHPAGILVPLALITLADWLENLVQAAQLRYFTSSHEPCAKSLWIQLASCSTVMKIWLTSGLYVTLAGLILTMLCTFSERRLTTDAVE